MATQEASSSKKKGESSFKTLTLETKIKIIEEHAAVTHGSISNVIKCKEKFVTAHKKVRSVGGDASATIAQFCVDNELEKAVYFWFLQKRTNKEPVSGPLLKQMALDLNAKLNGKPGFKASDGWLYSFKSRHGIRCLTISGERLSANTGDAEDFRQWFNDYLSRHNIDTDNVYNADETGLLWKSLPNKTLAGKGEVSAPGFKMNKERLTVMTCANATGTDRIPLLVIGKAKKPRSFKNKHHLPVVYDAQKSAWMDRTIFTKWFKEFFLVHVKERKPNDDERFILLLDNAPSHPPLQELNEIDPQCAVVYLPPNVTSVIQPMDQGCILAMKRMYQRAFLSELLAKESSDKSDVVQFQKSWSVYDCCLALADSWAGLSARTLRNSWSKLLEPADNETVEMPVVSDAVSLLNALPGDEIYRSEDVREWENEKPPTFRELNDDEIVQMVATKTSPTSARVLPPEEDPEGGDSEEGSDNEDNGPKESAVDLLKMTEKLCIWSQSEPDLRSKDCRALDKIRRVLINKIIYEYLG